MNTMSNEKLLIITEKPSAGRNFQQALGGKTGTFEGHPYVVVALRGHILAHETPEKVAFPEHKETVGGFAHIENIPWSYKYFDFDKRIIPSQVRSYANGVIGEMKSYLAKGYIPVVASDVDALGEGDLLVHEVLIHLNYKGKIYREYHADETPKSIQKALRDKVDVTEQNDGFVAGQTRMVLDFLTQQVTRVATITMQNNGYRLPRPVPVGRVQSTIMNLVGKQIDAVAAYTPSSEFESRYNLDDQLVLSNKDMERYPTKAEWKAGDLPKTATVKEVKQVPGKTIPPKALTLTGLGREMTKKGLNAKKTTELAQKMYDDGVISYPRTEDNFITPEQFKDMEPMVDPIIELLSLSPSVFSHRQPRKTHVKLGGSHGALRPGVNLPANIAGLDGKYGKGASDVYRAIAERFSMMFLEDTEWIRHEYETTDTPVVFKGSVRIVTKKGVMDPNEDTKDVKTTLPDTNKKAILYPHEVKSTRPQKPTESWLLGQLEKHQVGTAATQMPTVSRLSGPNNKFPLMAGKRASDALRLSPIGALGYKVAKEISLGEPESTRHFEQVIPLVVKGEKTADEVFTEFTELIEKDVNKIKSTSFDLDDLGFEKSARRVSGVWNGEEVSIFGSSRGYTFTDDEIERLFAGEVVNFVGEDFHKKPLKTSAKLGYITHKGKRMVGFLDGEYYYGEWKGEEVRFKRSFMTHDFTDEECERLIKGENVSIEVKSREGLATLTGELAKQKAPNGAEFVGYKAVWPLRDGYVKRTFKGQEIEFKGSFSDHVFTEGELDRLVAGEVVNVEFTTKNGKKMKVNGQLKKQTYKGNSFYGFKADFGK